MNVVRGTYPRQRSCRTRQSLRHSSLDRAAGSAEWPLSAIFPKQSGRLAPAFEDKQITALMKGYLDREDQ